MAQTVKALFTAYYPANNKMEGGFYDAQGNRLDPSKKTCAAPKSIPFGTKIKIQGTGTSRDGQIYTVTDRGGAITIKNGVYHFDLLMSSNRECNSWGKVNGYAVIGATESSTSSSSTSKKTTAKDIVDVAISQLGTKESSGGRTKYAAYTGTNGKAWCHAFVSWCAKEAGVSTNIVPKTASTDVGMAWFKKRNLFKYKGSYTPKRGDILYFKSANASHVGIVEYCSGGKVHTVEGNASHAVGRRSYVLNYKTITGYGTPNYASINDGSNSSTTADTSTTESKSKEITSQTIASLIGGEASYRDTRLRLAALGLQLPEQLFILTSKGEVHSPIIKGEVSWETQRKCTPGQLTFTIVKDFVVSFNEGDIVSFCHNGQKVFYGYVFKKSRQKDQHIKVTCYDQLRYFKNKTCMAIAAMSASTLFHNCCKEMKLHTALGYVHDTMYKLPARLEDNTTYFDILQTALDLTLQYTGLLYFMYDNYGYACLRRVGSVVSDCYIDPSQMKDYEYETSIDSETYNRIMLYYDDDETGVRKLHIAQDQKSMNEWGILQYVDSISTETGADEKAKVLLKAYNKRKRAFKAKNVIGNLAARAGSIVVLNMELGDLKGKARFFVVEKATHKFKDGRHTMDLTLVGGDFTA